MVASQPPDIVTVPLEEVGGKQKRVPPDFDLIRTARAMGISFGDSATSSLSREPVDSLDRLGKRRHFLRRL